MRSYFSGYFDFTRPFSPDSVQLEPGRIFWNTGEVLWTFAPDVSFSEYLGKFCVCAGRPIFPSYVSGESVSSRWLSLYSRQGKQGVEQVLGDWCVLIVSPQEQDFLLAVDRFSIQTACYSVENSRVAFAERADEVPVFDRELDYQSLYNYLHFHMIPAPGTVFRNIQRLPPGHRITVTNKTTDVSQYWAPIFDENHRSNFATAQANFLRIVEDAVRRNVGSDTVGAFLSGGTDSSTVAGMLCRTTGSSCDTYSIGFDSEGYDEMEYARIASRHFGTKHHEYYVTPDDLLEGIPAVAQYHDQPFGNSSAVPAFFCTRMAQADGMTRLLAGDGGDELFGGNSRYASQRLFDAYRFFPRTLRQHVLEPMLADTHWPRKIPVLRQAGGYMRHSRVPLPERMETFNLIDSLGPENILTEDFLNQVDRSTPMEHRRKTWRECKAGSLINRMLAYDWKFTLADSDLPKVRGATRMAGITVGFPLLDDALTDFSLSLQPDWKLKKFKLRWFFKESLKGFLPKEIITKKKHGFGLPFGPWAIRHAGLRQLANRSLDNLVDRRMVQGNFVRELFGSRLPEHPGYYGEMVWILMMLEQWLAKLDNAQPAKPDR